MVSNVKISLVWKTSLQSTHRVLQVLGRGLPDAAEQVLADLRDDALLLGAAHHRVRLARAGLPVREYADVVA